MTGKYTPIRHELCVVETYNHIPDDPAELQKFTDMLSAKYQAEVSIDKHQYTKREWSWRTDTQYTVDRTEYQIKCLQPVYSAADNKAMHDDAMRAFLDKYKDAFKK